VPIPDARIPFVGRQRELLDLSACLDTAAEGNGVFVLVSGEAGIGKTRLLAEFAGHAQSKSWKVLSGRAYDTEGMPPYLPFTEALRDYVRDASVDGLRASIDAAGPEIALLVPDLARRLPDVTPTTASAIEEDRYRLFDSVATFLVDIPRHSDAPGLVLILDDLHWSEHSTVLLLQHCSHRLAGSRLVLVGAYRSDNLGRDHPLSGLLAEQRRLDTSVRLVLSPLEIDEVALLVGGFGYEAPDAVVEAVARQSGGNPFYVGELVRDLLAQNQDLRTVNPATVAERVPDGVREVIGHLLSRMSQPVTALLRVAAVLGDGFSAQTLQSATGYESSVLLDSLDEAVAAGMLRETRGGYQFGHALVRRAIYDGLGLARRQLLHQQVARGLEQQYAGGLREHAAEMAEHLAQSPDPLDLARAVGFAELAAKRALDMYAYGEAAAHLEHAIQSQLRLNPGDTVKRCELLLALGQALLPAGQSLRAAEQIAPDALALAEQMDDDDRSARASLLALEGLFRYGRAAMWSTSSWDEWAQRADRAARPQTTDRARADLFMGMRRIQEGRVGEGRALLGRALDLARDLDDAETFLRAAEPLLNWVRPSDADEQWSLASEVAGRPRSRAGTGQFGRTLWNCSCVFLGRGERSKAEDLQRQAVDMAERTHDQSQSSWAREIWRATFAGDLDSVIALGRQLLAQTEDAGTPVTGLVFSSRATCRALLYLGREQQALSALSEIERRLGAGRTLGDAELRGLCLAQLGQREEAQQALDRFIAETSSQSEAGGQLTFTLTTWLETALLLRNRGAVAQLLPRLAPVAGLAAGTVALVPTCIARHLGAGAALMGDAEMASAYYEQALELACNMGHRPEVALTHLQMAELQLGGAGSARRARPTSQQAGAIEHLKFAGGEFERMHMHSALMRARALGDADHAPRAANSPAANPDGLTTREIEVLRLMAAGMGNREIALELTVSINTVFQHVRSILAKTGTANRTQAAAHAHRHGLVP
jgi:DNA-binding CsgD family transcriptional regulator/tetratricopeptide (TPR) repeat protein